jgi:hypothetical protein
MRYRWEGLVLLTGNEWPGVRPEAGIYRIRIFDPAGCPLAIARALGTDPDGCWTSARVETCTAASTPSGAALEGKRTPLDGAEYASWELQRYWPLDRLHFDFFHVPDKKTAEQAELRMLDAYRVQFYDRPPLNKSQGKRRKHGSG